MKYEKGLDKAKKYLKTTMEWRAKNAAALAAMRDNTTAAPNDAVFRSFINGTLHYKNADGHYTLLLRSGLGNTEAVLEKMKPAEITAYLTLTKEQLFGLCDADTRLKGKLISFNTILDFAHATFE